MSSDVTEYVLYTGIQGSNTRIFKANKSAMWYNM